MSSQSSTAFGDFIRSNNWPDNKMGGSVEEVYRCVLIDELEADLIEFNEDSTITITFKNPDNFQSIWLEPEQIITLTPRDWNG